MAKLPDNYLGPKHRIEMLKKDFGHRASITTEVRDIIVTAADGAQTLCFLVTAHVNLDREIISAGHSFTDSPENNKALEKAETIAIGRALVNAGYPELDDGSYEEAMNATAPEAKPAPKPAVKPAPAPKTEVKEAVADPFEAVTEAPKAVEPAKAPAKSTTKPAPKPLLGFKKPGAAPLDPVPLTAAPIAATPLADDPNFMEVEEETQVEVAVEPEPTETAPAPARMDREALLAKYGKKQ